MSEPQEERSKVTSPLRQQSGSGTDTAAMRLELLGEVDTYGAEWPNSGPTIGGVDLIAELETRFPSKPWRGTGAVANVRVYLGVEPVAEGPLWACHGFGGTDVTPPESPEIRVGDTDLFRWLDDLDGRVILLIVELAQEGGHA